MSREELEQLLDEAFIMDPSFLGADAQTRLSLAGVQDKLPVMAGEMEKRYGGNPIYAQIVAEVEVRAGRVLRQSGGNGSAEGATS